jgi:hypothetical protein
LTQKTASNADIVQLADKDSKRSLFTAPTKLVTEKGKENHMRIEVTTDANIHGHEELLQRVGVEVKLVLGRFMDQIMSVEVHLTDENGAKHGSADKRCLMEARCFGRPPVAVSHESATLEGAFHGAAKKLQRLLKPSLGKADAHKGGETIRKENPVESEDMGTERL